MIREIKKKPERPDNSKRAAMITVLTCFTMLLCITTVLFLANNQKIMSNEFNRIVRTDLGNKENISHISQTLYNHQKLIFQYMTAGSPEKNKEALRSEANNLENEIKSYLDTFGDSVNGTEYEPYYHSMYSDINGYFSNIGNVLYFADTGDIPTAYYYMETSMNSYITEVNRNVKEFDTLMSDDLSRTELMMERKSENSEHSTLLAIIVCSAFSVTSIFISSRISKLLMSQDALTQLDNYERFQKIAADLEKKEKLSDYTCIFCNIKDFRFYNSRFGDKTGDTVLIEYAALFREFLNRDEYAARNGGDSFSVLLKSEREDQFFSFLKQIQLYIGDNLTDIESYCGIYSIQPGDRPGNIFAACNLALSTARTSGAADHIRYEKKMFEELSSRKDTLLLCQQGLKNGEFIVYYQPKVDMTTNTLCGCEALVRWLHDGKLIPPSHFIDILESEGAVNDLDFYIFEKVCAAIAQWKSSGIEPVRVSSNFSKLHLKDRLFADKILSAVKKYEIDTKYIEVELTESSAYEDFPALSEFVSVMKENGIHTSMDDFGTGYSSLSLLKDLNVDVIKIDKSFIDGLEKGDRAHEKMIENIVHMIKDLDRDVICEGVETPAQAEFLKNIQCTVAQGYLYDRPLAHEEFEKRLLRPEYIIMQ